VGALMAGAITLFAGCGGGSGDSSSGGDTAASAEAACGLANGETATGDPIKVGAVVTNGAGVDSSSATDGAAAFFPERET
jgi:branched-chain amino acid transport system substrate-binding protein